MKLPATGLSIAGWPTISDRTQTARQPATASKGNTMIARLKCG